MERSEAIERIKARYDKWALDNEDMKAIQALIPELKESEDERIRKAIEGTIRVYGKTQGEWLCGYDMDTLVIHLREAFGALERQKEQKHSLNFDAISSWLRDHVSRYVNSEFNEFHHCTEYDGTINVERLIANTIPADEVWHMQEDGDFIPSCVP